MDLFCNAKVLRYPKLYLGLLMCTLLCPSAVTSDFNNKSWSLCVKHRDHDFIQIMFTICVAYRPVGKLHFKMVKRNYICCTHVDRYLRSSEMQWYTVLYVLLYIYSPFIYRRTFSQLRAEKSILTTPAAGAINRILGYSVVLF